MRQAFQLKLMLYEMKSHEKKKPSFPTIRKYALLCALHDHDTKTKLNSMV
jgi:hypothetical protein